MREECKYRRGRKYMWYLPHVVLSEAGDEASHLTGNGWKVSIATGSGNNNEQMQLAGEFSRACDTTKILCKSLL